MTHFSKTLIILSILLLITLAFVSNNEGACAEEVSHIVDSSMGKNGGLRKNVRGWNKDDEEDKRKVGVQHRQTTFISLPLGTQCVPSHHVAWNSCDHCYTPATYWPSLQTYACGKCREKHSICDNWGECARECCSGKYNLKWDWPLGSLHCD
mmetsp:Transcript_26971/g.38674  ORF Transcript_26971/g.38674 Transcript_26971/m.38674 type:complete len:152 (+) Transcript_26971:384-839(+)|eukprot:CAMPEP_0172433944 /NCGR_PEP_ID=MMETSP1064-20121228/70337_1 /TAXON_ID=202472 /ORGANISM="Aulacoseira subarctica , Strain CCAP 1002/5" /LENGTH=151 /DNA_ID=CAMNT_0013182135 /DNA_START=281 /DNA_END=736 /DNA_ORIENTATION=-